MDLWDQDIHWNQDIQLKEALLVLKTRRCANCANLILDTVPGYCLDECDYDVCSDFLKKRTVIRGSNNA